MPLVTCPDCESNVSDRALSCPHCGAPIKASENADASQWEHCEIGWWQEQNPVKFVLSFGRKSHRIWARAIHPTRGVYPAAQSDKFSLDIRYSDSSNGILNQEPDARDPNANAAFSEVVDQLLAAGWEQEPVSGPRWYSLRFRRHPSDYLPPPPDSHQQPRRWPLNRTQQSTLGRAVIMAIYVVLTIFPFYWMFITAFKQNSDLYELSNNPLIFNAPPTLSHIDYLFRNTLFGTWMWNSLVIGVAVVLITLLIATPAGYALARLDLPMADKLGMAIFATYLIPPSLLFIPLTRVVFSLGLANTIWSLILVLPTISIPFAVWLLMGFFKNVPKEIEEAALVDGCSRPQAVFKVVLPISKAGLSAAGMFAFAISLQAFLYPLVFTSSGHVKPVTLGVVTDLIRGDIFYWGELMAGALLAGLPVAIVFNFFLNDFIEGITGGAVK